jgi:hypothetical protein
LIIFDKLSISGESDTLESKLSESPSAKTPLYLAHLRVHRDMPHRNMPDELLCLVPDGPLSERITWTGALGDEMGTSLGEELGGKAEGSLHWSLGELLILPLGELTHSSRD